MTKLRILIVGINWNGFRVPFLMHDYPESREELITAVALLNELQKEKGYGVRLYVMGRHD